MKDGTIYRTAYKDHCFNFLSNEFNFTDADASVFLQHPQFGGTASYISIIEGILDGMAAQFDNGKIFTDFSMSDLINE